VGPCELVVSSLFVVVEASVIVVGCAVTVTVAVAVAFVTVVVVVVVVVDEVDEVAAVAPEVE